VVLFPVAPDFATHSAVIDDLKKAALALVQKAAVEVTCPKCQFRFKPFAAATPESFAQLMQAVPCPKCGHTFSYDEGAKTKTDVDANPPGPFSKPEASRIELVGEEGNWVFVIPRGRVPIVLLIVAAVENLISWPVISVFYWKAFTQSGATTTKDWLIPALFPLAGLVLIYFVLRLGFATHRLIISPQTVRLERKMIFKKVFTLRVEEVTRVRKKEFYSQNYRPVYGIEFTAGQKRIRFGSNLTEDEKNWICWQSRELLRQRGAPVED
jgi:hypothetical protein